jgi:hypothetical protein
MSSDFRKVVNVEGMKDGISNNMFERLVNSNKYVPTFSDSQIAFICSLVEASVDSYVAYNCYNVEPDESCENLRVIGLK